MTLPVRVVGVLGDPVEPVDGDRGQAVGVEVVGRRRCPGRRSPRRSVPRPYQSGRIAVVLPLGSVYVAAAAASSVAAAGLPDVPLLVQPCSWYGAELLGRAVGRVIVPTRSAVVGDRDRRCDSGSLTWVSRPDRS